MSEAKNPFSSSYASPFSLTSSDFSAWSSRNHYRTSSLDMSQKVPVPAKSYVIPGYSGFIPGKADSPLEKSKTWVSKEQLSREKYLPFRTTENFPNRPGSSKRLLGKAGGGLEDEYPTISRFHGKSTIPATHPNSAM